MIEENDVNLKKLYEEFLPLFIDLVKFLEQHMERKSEVFIHSKNIIINILQHQILEKKSTFKYEFKNFAAFGPILEKIEAYFFKLNVDETSILVGNLFEYLLRTWDEKELNDETKIMSTRLTERKTKGVFYTPKRITRYMAERIFSELFLTRLNMDCENIIMIFSLMENLSINELKKLNEIIKNLRIIDPACGSGAFILESAELLFKIKKFIATKTSIQVKSIELKKEIIESNLHGVDIYSNAIEITKLRLQLWFNGDFKILDSDKIDENFLVGNSLHEIELTSKFDIVISNPPYGRTILTSQQDKIKDFLVASKDHVKKPSYNASSLFIERGLTLLKTNGHLGMIVPSSVARTEEFEGIRNIILDQSDLYEIVDEGKAFSEVTLEMIILFLKKSDIKRKKVKIISRRDGTIRNVKKQIFKTYNRFILYHDTLFEFIMKNSLIDIVQSRSGIDHRLIKYMHKKDQSKEKDESHQIPFLHSGKTVKRYHLDESEFHYINEKNLSLARFKQECEEFDIVTVAISPFIRASVKLPGIIPGTNIQIVSFNTEKFENADLYYFLALINSKFLRIFFHVYIQNKIKYTFKIQDYHTRYYPIMVAKDKWIYSFFAKILTRFPNFESIEVIDTLLDFLVIELYFHYSIGLELTKATKILLKENNLDNFDRFDKILIKELILKIRNNELINEQINRIKNKLILDENKLEIKILDIGCYNDG